MLKRSVRQGCRQSREVARFHSPSAPSLLSGAGVCVYIMWHADNERTNRKGKGQEFEQETYRANGGTREGESQIGVHVG